jgi:hypothetical protein
MFKTVMDAVATIPDPEERRLVEKFIVASEHVISEIRAGAGHPATDHGTGLWLQRVIEQYEETLK